MHLLHSLSSQPVPIFLRLELWSTTYDFCVIIQISDKFRFLISTFWFLTPQAWVLMVGLWWFQWFLIRWDPWLLASDLLLDIGIYIRMHISYVNSAPNSDHLAQEGIDYEFNMHRNFIVLLRLLFGSSDLHVLMSVFWLLSVVFWSLTSHVGVLAYALASAQFWISDYW